MEGTGDSGSLRVAESFAEIGTDGAVLLARWRQELGSELDLQVVAGLIRFPTCCVVTLAGNAAGWIGALADDATIYPCELRLQTE